jgi:TadE-like protein
MPIHGFALPGRRIVGAWRRAGHRDERGQSLVEFALLLPLLLIILLGVADFGRVFQAGIVMESATRAAAEAGAVEYLRQVSTGNEPDYNIIQARAADVACREAKLENVTDPGTCAQWPVIRVCIHDLLAGHVNCGQPQPPQTGSVPAECGATAIPSGTQGSGLTVQPTDANPTPREAYVEVRTCYRFTTLIPVNDFLPIGEVFLQREAVFTVADY